MVGISDCLGSISNCFKAQSDDGMELQTAGAHRTEAGPSTDAAAGFDRALEHADVPDIVVTQHDPEPGPPHMLVPPDIVISAPEDELPFGGTDALPLFPARDHAEYRRHYAAQSVAYNVVARSMGLRNSGGSENPTARAALEEAVLKTRTESFPLGRGNVRNDIARSDGGSFIGAASAQDFWPKTAFGRHLLENHPEDEIAFRGASARLESAGVCFDHGIQTAMNLSSSVPHSDEISVLADDRHDHVSVSHQGRIGDAWAEGAVVETPESMAHEHRDHISSTTLDAASWKQVQARSEEIERQLGEQLSSREVRAARDSFGSGLKPRAALIVEGRDHGERPFIYDSAPHVLASTFRERIAGWLSQVPQEELNNKIQDAVASATASGVGERLLDRDVLVELQRLATK